jgi:DNA-binding CsgD family transcriptional regulator/tetratricopeptide (TPR) repeat protein
VAALQPATTLVQTRAAMSVPSDIICDVGLDSVASGIFVGRDEEAARLAQLLGIDSEDASGLVLLSGDAGIGKTRLLAETTARARDLGWRVLVGHCLGEAGQSMPYLPFGEMLGRLEAAEPDTVEALIREHASLAGLFPGRRRRPIEAAEDRVLGAVDQTELVEAAHSALEDLARDLPVLVVVEDVHWADQSSRDLLTLLFTRGFAGRVSIVASYRSDDLHRRHPLRATLAHWSRLGDLRRLDLAPLSDAAVRELVYGVQSRPLSEPEVTAVVERAEGNAFFAEELVAASVLGRPGVAEDLSRLLLVRFDQLGPSGQHVVRTAAAAGRHVSHVLLATVAGLPDAELDQGLRDAVEHHVLVPTESGGYAFRHALLAETVYDDLLPGERVRAHERYAAALTSDPSLGTWADLARHAAAAGDRDAALVASINAGDAALLVGGPQEAWRHYQQALALMPDSHPEADSVVLRAAAAATAKGQALKGLALLEERLARRGADASPAGRAELLAAVATTARLTESPLDTLAATREGLALLDDEAAQHPQTRARLLGAHVQALADRGRDDEALKASEEAVAAARAAGLPEVADEVRVVEARVLERAGDPETSRRTLERIIAESTTTGDPAQVRAFHHLGSLHHRLGRLDSAVEIYCQGAEAGRAAGRMWAPYAFDSRLLAGVAAYEVGRWDQALEILDVAGQTPPQPAEALLTGARLNVWAGRGQGGFEAPLAAARSWWESEGMVAVLAGGAAIDLHGHAGDLVAAVDMYDDIVTTLSRVWHPLFQAQVRLGALLLGQLGSFVQRVPTDERPELLARGRETAEAADAVWARASTMAGQDGPESQAWIARARAEALRLRWLGGDDVDPARLAQAWRSSVEAFERYGHRYETARSQARLGVLLQACGAAGASEALQSALATARQLGAEPLRAELRAAGGARPSQGRPAQRLGEALTPREQEILALVALGRSNRQIGTQLFISAKTASVHVSNILAKLGASGRGEAVAVARERGLLD